MLMIMPSWLIWMILNLPLRYNMDQQKQIDQSLAEDTTKADNVEKNIIKKCKELSDKCDNVIAKIKIKKAKK